MIVWLAIVTTNISADGFNCAEAILMPVAQYLRMSSEHQKYSTANQSEVNHIYAAGHSMEIIQTYADEGISGLTFDKRDALRQLIEDVQSGRGDFRAILVYDVTRWGRFQDPDESAYYEYLCRRAGITVHYCAEQFENDGTPFAAIVKAIKRAMAGEYSRDLSVKVHAGQTRILKLGYRVGGSVGYGLRRVLVDPNGTIKGVLARGQLKSIQSDRIVLGVGPPEETAVIRWIFRAFVRQRKSESDIAHMLNRRGIANVGGRAWNYGHVRRILTNENYIGNAVWNRQCCKLKSKAIDNEPEKWIRVPGVIEPVVEPSAFEAARVIIESPPPALSQEEKLAPLRKLLSKHGTLSARLIDESRSAPSATSYYRWFGGLTKTYELLGFTGRSHCRDGRPRRSRHADTLGLTNDDLLSMLVRLYQAHGYLTRDLINRTEGIPSSGTFTRRFGSLERAYELIGLPWTFPNRPPRRPHRSTVSLSDEQLLEKLRWLLATHGRITRKLIDATRAVPSAATYQRRFRGVLNAYRSIGYAPQQPTRGLTHEERELSEERLLANLRSLLKRHGYLCARIMNAHEGVAAASTYRRHFRSLTRAYQLIGYGKAPSSRSRKIPQPSED